MSVIPKHDINMQQDVDSVVSAIQNVGVVVVEGYFDDAFCDKYRAQLDAQLEERIATKSYCGNEENQVLDNYFMGHPELLDLLYQDLTDSVMRRLIDDDYVLISPSARNRRNMPDRSFGKRTSGHGWHTDSRFIGGGKGFNPSLCYMSIICVDGFTRTNGATHFIPKSHLRYERPSQRDAEVPFEYLEAPKGSLVIFDTALWHRIGPASEQSRWGVFNTYGPWFMKPYHRFLDMFAPEQVEGFSPVIRQLLHWDSWPPRDHDERMVTLRRVNL